MKIGPLGGKTDALSRYIVFPGKEGKDVFYAQDDYAALEQVLYEYQSSNIAVEELLKEAAEDFNIPVSPISQSAAHRLSLFALDLYPGGPFKRITVDGIIYRFCESVHAFRQFSRMGKKIDQVRLAISGATTFETEAFLFDDSNDGVVVAIMMQQPDVHETPRPEDFAEVDRIWVETHRRPTSILNALQRAHALDVIPIPYQRSHGVDGRVQDMHLAVLVSTLSAISSLKGRNDRGTSEFKIAGYEVRATVTID